MTFPLSFLGELIILFLSLSFAEGEWYENGIKMVLLAYIPVGYFTWEYLVARKRAKYDEVVSKRNQGRTTLINRPASASTTTVEHHELQNVGGERT